MNNNVETPQEESSLVKEIISNYCKTINSTPVLLSLLYDADLLPEQIISVRGAISMAAVVTAYEEGVKETKE